MPLAAVCGNCRSGWDRTISGREMRFCGILQGEEETNGRYTTQRLDHLGIVAGICQEISLAEQIDRIIGPTERQVSVGEAAYAMS
ncbi:MAG: DUF4277 domain-containing protein [Thermoflexia bacterium]|nr:MAG: DUF4277 domain-containing protein [Thermoflexia bacterium]